MPDYERIKALQAELDELLATATSALAQARLVSTRLNERLSDTRGGKKRERERDLGGRQQFCLSIIMKAGGPATGEGWASDEAVRRLLEQSGREWTLSLFTQTIDSIEEEMFVKATQGWKLTPKGHAWAEKVTP